MTSSQDNEEGYSPDGGFDGPGLLKVSPEQRLIMRNIPFFVLPPHETTPRTAHIGPKIDNHNTSYVPAQPHKREKPYTQKFDYSQVKSRINTGRSTSPASLESTSKSFGLSARARSRVNAYRSSSPSPVSSNRNIKPRVNAGQSKSERSSSSADYSHIKSRIDVGHPSTLSAKSERLNSSADSGLKSRISSTGQTSSLKLNLSSLPDYSHIKSRTDSGQRPSSKSSGSPRSSSMSHNKARPAEGTARSSQAVKFASSSHRLSRAELPRSRVPLSDTFPSKARKSSPTGSVNRYRGVTGLKFGSPEKYHQRFGNCQAGLSNSIARQLEPEFGRLSSAARSFPRDTPGPVKISTNPVNFSAKAKSRIDCSDPNPAAHKLKHSLNELTIPLGRDINPRFTSRALKASRLVKSSSLHIEKPIDKTESESSLVKSSTFDSLFEVDSQKSGIPDLETEIEIATQASTNPTKSVSSASPEDSPAMEVGLETVHHHHKLGWTEPEYAMNGAVGHNMMFSEAAYSTQGKKYEDAVNSDDLNDIHRTPGESAASTCHEDSKADTFGGQCAFEYSHTVPRYSRDQFDEDDIQIVDFEVTNSETETTVVLKHLLALSSLREKENETTGTTSNHVSRSTGSSPLWTMPAIEESDSEENESYYESEEVVTPPPSVPIVPYTLPIPTLNLQDEDGTILETILKGTEGLKTDNDGNATVDSSDSLVAKYSPKTVYDDFGPSTNL